MINKLAIIAAVLATSIVPALAQSFAGYYGTGNVSPSFYGQDGALHQGVPTQQQNRIAAHRSGLNAFAMVPSAAAPFLGPTAQGGGSIGYNENLKTDQW